MTLIRRFLCVSAFGLAALSSCAKFESDSYDKFEKVSLAAWMTQHHPELVDNYQPAGTNNEYGYYVEVLKEGDPLAKPIGDGESWVSYDFSGRDLYGNIILTRNASEAKQVGTFTKYTHYVPYYRLCGASNSGLLEGAHLAMRNTLNYKDATGETKQLRLREGSKVRLFLPSLLIGSAGMEGSGGYEGQTSLSSQRPMILTLEIRDTIANPLEREGKDVDAYGALNGQVEIFNTKENKIPKDTSDVRHPYSYRSKRWASASDTLAQLYVNYRFDPKADRLSYPNPYNVGYEPYDQANLSVLDQKISEALVKRFHKDADYKGVTKLTSDSVKLDGTAKIWYIGRFLDGFIFDTNIDEVKKLIYGEVKSSGTVLSYTPKDGGLIKAFYYSVPKLRYGQWAALITTSTYAYGSTGQSGSSSTSSSGGSSSGDYMNYMNYVNGYYGSGGYYGGYYNDYYNNYSGGAYSGYYDDAYGSGNTGSSTTTTVSTEIPSFTPLIFEIYIEPKK